jgi:hypothetical protein
MNQKLQGPGFYNLMDNAGYKRPSFRVSFTLALCIAAGLVFLGWKAVGL